LPAAGPPEIAAGGAGGRSRFGMDGPPQAEAQSGCQRERVGTEGFHR